MKARVYTLAAVLAVSACVEDAPPSHDGPTVAPSDSLAERSVALVDSTLPPAVAGEYGWNYQVRAEADLTGDALPEQVVLTAQVELYRGRPAWDDGQPWQVYVEAPDGARTYVYAQRLQLGTLAMRLGLGDDGQPTSIVLLEHLPDRLSVYEATYRGPGQTTVTRRYQRALDPRGEAASPRLP